MGTARELQLDFHERAFTPAAQAGKCPKNVTSANCTQDVGGTEPSLGATSIGGRVADLAWPTRATIELAFDRPTNESAGCHSFR